jgi:hypothetical protein
LVLATLGLAGDNNAAISPDGQTVLTAGNGGSTVFRVAGPGNLVPGSMPQLTIPFPGIQSAS